MGDIRLVVTDLDGTLIGGDDDISAGALAALREIMWAPDVELLIATGRRFGSAHRVLSRHGVTPPAVLMAGAVGADLATGDLWHRHALDAEAGLTALQILRDHGLEPVVYVGDADLDAMAGAACSSNPAHLDQFGASLQRGAPDEVVASGRSVGLGVCGVTHEGLDAVAAALAGVVEPWLGPDHVFGGRTLMLSPAGVTKVRGLDVWCAAHDIRPAQVMAIGDGSNDVDMLAWAGVAVAVEGGVTMADPHDHVIASPEQDGWAAIPRLL